MIIRTLAAHFVLVALALPLPAAAQQARAPRNAPDNFFRSGTVALTLAAGGAAFTDFRRDEAELSAGDGIPVQFTRRISAQTTLTGAGSIQLWLNGIAGVRVQAGYAPTRFVVSSREIDALLPIDTTRYSRLDIWLYDASLLLRPPISVGRVAPYVILGAGAVNYRVKDGLGEVPPEAAASFDDSDRTQWAGVLGLGGVVPLQRDNLLLSFEITDHFARTPLEDEANRLVLDESGTVVHGDARAVAADDISLASTVRLTVGLTIPIRLR